jgi:hypothetical protein
VSQRTDCRDAVVEPVAAAHQRESSRIHVRGEGESEFGVGLIFVGGVPRDHRLCLCPFETRLAHRVEIADEPRRRQPGLTCMVEAAVDGEDDRLVREGLDDVRRESS